MAMIRQVWHRRGVEDCKRRSGGSGRGGGAQPPCTAVHGHSQGAEMRSGAADTARDRVKAAMGNGELHVEPTTVI